MITLIIGNHPRHFYFASKLQNFLNIETLIIERRENFFTNDKELTNLEKIHFKKRSEAEFSFFGKVNENNIKSKSVFFINREDLNNGKLEKILQDKENLNLISYGCHKLDNKILNKFKFNKWNVHGGLSPSYRGSITHFWPSYLLEPEFTGMTLHKLTQDIDGGEIIYQSVVDLNKDDGIHENAARCVKEFSDKIGNKLKNINFEKELIGISQNSTGRIWTSKMWTPKLLDVIYNHFEDKINKFCFENNSMMNSKEINLKSVLD